MHGPKAFALVAAIAAAGFAESAAHAQFGYYQLPANDFVWNWGNPERSIGFEDFTVTGGEGGFHCELKGKVSPGSRMTPTDFRALEEQLRSRLDFIYATSSYMNQLDQQRELDWAKLSCAKPQAAPSTEQEKADREAKAREKMQHEIDRRRAHQPQTDSQ
jgi:hypothetical protein